MTEKKLETNKKHAFIKDRLKDAVRYGWITSTLFLVVFAILFFLFYSMPSDYLLFDTFQEWKPTDSTVKVGKWYEEIFISISRIGDALSGIFNSATFLDENNKGNIAGIARLISTLSIMAAVFWSYRKQLEERYKIERKCAQYNDFKELKNDNRFLITRFLYVIATGFGTYVIISVIWLVLSQAFKGLELDKWGALIVVVGFTWTVTIGAVYWALAVTTREVLLIGIVTFIAGLLLSFSIAPVIELDDGTLSYWWQHAISRTGKDLPSAPIFIATLMSMSFMLWVVWYDIDSLIDNAHHNDEPKKTKWIRLLYFYAIVSILLIAFVRVGNPIFFDFFVNFLLHTVFGGVGSIIALVLMCRMIRKIIRPTIFSDWYWLYFWCTAIISIVVLFISSVHLNPFGFGDSSNPLVGKGIINLTVAELITFILTGLLFYVTVEMLLLQADILDSTDCAEEDTIVEES